MTQSESRYNGFSENRYEVKVGIIAAACKVVGVSDHPVGL